MRTFYTRVNNPRKNLFLLFKKYLKCTRYSFWIKFESVQGVTLVTNTFEGGKKCWGMFRGTNKLNFRYGRLARKRKKRTKDWEKEKDSKIVGLFSIGIFVYVHAVSWLSFGRVTHTSMCSFNDFEYEESVYTHVYVYVENILNVRDIFSG